MSGILKNCYFLVIMECIRHRKLKIDKLVDVFDASKFHSNILNSLKVIDE